MNGLESSIRKIKEIIELRLPKEKPCVLARGREYDTGVDNKDGAREHKWKSAVWDPSRCRGYIGARDNHDLDPIGLGLATHVPNTTLHHRQNTRSNFVVL